MEEIVTARVLHMVEATMGVAISTQAVVATMAILHTAAAIAARDLHTAEVTVGEAISTQAVVATTVLAHHMEEGATTVQGLQTRAILLIKAAISTQAAAATMAIDQTVEATAVRDHLTVEATVDPAHHIKEETSIPRTTTAEITLEADTRTSLTIETVIIETTTTETDTINGKVTNQLKGTRTTVIGVAIADILQLTAQLTVHEIHMKATLEVDLLQSAGTILEVDRHQQEEATLEVDRHLEVQAREVSHHLFPAHAQKLPMLGSPLITLPAQTMAKKLSASLDAEIGATSLWNVNSVATTQINGGIENAVKAMYNVKITDRKSVV